MQDKNVFINESTLKNKIARQIWSTIIHKKKLQVLNSTAILHFG